MEVEVSRSEVGGRARAPPSKSYTHRAVLAAGFSPGTTLESPLMSADTRATIRAIEAFGANVRERETGPTAAGERQTSLQVDGFDGIPVVPDDVIDCANSGTTMRLVTATAALADGLTVLTGDSSLRSRPQGPLLEAIGELNGRAESTRRNGQAPLVVGGPIEGGEVAIRGDVSSQFVTALLMAGAATAEGIHVELTTELKSAPYVEITRELLAAFGVDTERHPHGFAVAGGQRYVADRYAIPGDFSSMSYLLAAGAVAGTEPVVVEGAHPSAQGDSAFVDILDRMGARIEWDRDTGEITVERAPLTGIEVSVADTPDLLPTVAAVGAVADGRTRITDCEHVRYKETDRVSAMATELERLGARVTEEQDRLTVHGSDSRLEGTSVDSRGDHRLAMALAVVGMVAEGTTAISEAEHVDVSFPGFFDALSTLGARVGVPE